jgi:hypothetical protein
MNNSAGHKKNITFTTDAHAETAADNILGYDAS